MDHHQKTGAQLNPKASVLYMAPTGTDLRLSVGRGYRAPSLQDLYEGVGDMPAGSQSNAGCVALAGAAVPWGRSPSERTGVLTRQADPGPEGGIAARSANRKP